MTDPRELEAWDYELPPDRIAQEPADRRDRARLLVCPLEGGPFLHRSIRNLPDLLRPGDLLCLNDARVLPARLRGRRKTGASLEALLLDEVRPGVWTALVDKARRLKEGETIELGSLEPTVRGREGPRTLLDFGDADVRAAMEREGELPLPPYIERSPDDPRRTMDRERYQTVFAAREGAVAAPTAGLHLTDDLLDELRRAGVEVATLTLDVGIGTFLPIRTDRVDEHEMHAETYAIPEETLAALDGAERVVACGTTVVRALEAHARTGRAGGETDLFIAPGHEFRTVDGLLTNFHLPRSTLLVLVGALAGRERILEAYRTAVAEGYRFYSYGDAMLLV